MAKTHHTKVLIIGSGPAGYAASIYAARAGLEPILVTGLEQGGQMTTTTDVENYPGFPAIMGPELMKEMLEHAKKFGRKEEGIINDLIVSVDLKSNPKKMVGDSGDIYLADTVIIATGAQAKWLGLPSEEQYKGRGVSGCATCDANFFRGQEVMVVGGGNTAVEEALFLTNLVSKVTLIHRGDKFRAEQIMQDRLFKNPKIEVLFNTELQEVKGDVKGVNGAKVKNNKTGATTDISLSGIFIAIGHKPASELFKGQVDIDKDGYIVTEKGSTLTSVPGVYAAGDVMDKVYRQAVVAAGTGCMAALDAEEYIASLEAVPVPKKAKAKTPNP
jgi:thioredoxin reductase (NADPH)